LVASSTSALAAGPYIGAAGGLSILRDSDLEVSGVGTAIAKFDTGYGFNVSAGYKFDPIRLEFEFGYKNADLDKLSGPGGSVSVQDAEVTVLSYMVNAFYDINTDSPLTPYVGAGLGLLNGEIKVPGSKKDDNEVGYQAIFGAAYNLNKNLAIDLSYRFQGATSDFSKDGVSLEYKSNNIMAGMRYNF